MGEGEPDIRRRVSNRFRLSLSHPNIFQLLYIMLNYLQKRNVKVCKSLAIPVSNSNAVPPDRLRVGGKRGRKKRPPDVKFWVHAYYTPILKIYAKVGRFGHLINYFSEFNHISGKSPIFPALYIVGE
jgi:hypothetical protein